MYNNIIQSHTIISLIKYCRNTFQYLRQSMKISRKVCLIPLTIPFSETNGFTVSLGLKNKALDFIFINLWPFRKKESSATMISFYLFSVIAHELKHVKILEDWYNGKTDTFGILFSSWAVNHTGGEGFFNRIIRFYFSSKGTSQLRKKRYDVSPLELICYYFGFQESFNHYAHLLSQQEREIASTILHSLEFINRYIDIDYFTSKQAYNRFTHTLYYIQKSFTRHPEQLQKYPQFSCIFTPSGLLKSPSQIFADRTKDNTDLLDQILIRMFITLSFNWQDIFIKEQQFYDHICKLANTYCSESINYLKNIVSGEVFLSKSVLQDNAAMLIKNVNTLNQLMSSYHMPRTSGSVLPLFYSDDFTKQR